MAEDKISVLIILTGALGDVARGVSILKPLKQGYPDCRITWLVEKKWRDFLEIHPLIDQIVEFDRAAGFSGFRDTIRNVRKLKIDVVLDMQRYFKSGVFSRFSGATRRIGFHPKDCKEGNSFFNTEFIVQRGNRYPKILHYHDFLSKLNIDWNGQVDFGLSDVRNKLARDIPQSSAYRYKTGVVLGSSWSSKNWTQDGYRELLCFLEARGDIETVLLGDSSQSKQALRLVQDSKSVQDLTGKTSLPELCSQIASCDFLVGPDSGPGHIAAAFGIPYIGLFGPTDPARVAPFGSGSLAIRSGVGCAPCLKRKCPGLGNVCMKLISLPEIQKSIENMLLEVNSE